MDSMATMMALDVKGKQDNEANMIRTRILASILVALWLGLFAALDASGGTARNNPYQTIPNPSTLYLPLILRQDAPTPTPIPTLTPTPMPTATSTPRPTPAPSCDASYPTLCIPPPPPDLNCRDVLPHRRFPVLPPDPHGFDSDQDGIGCE